MVKKLQALKAKKGFTLVELIIVIAIIGVLAAILIPTLSGVIDNSRKKSAESTCQSIQSLAKTFASQVLAKKGETCTSTSTVDMDDGKGEVTMKAYIEAQVPELVSTSSKTKRNATITLVNGEVSSVVYCEGSFKAEWNTTDGMKEGTKESTATTTTGCTVSGGAATGSGTATGTGT